MKGIDDFCKMYDATIHPSSKLLRRQRQIDYQVLSETDSADFDVGNFYDEIQCVEIHMPEDRFRALLEHDDWITRAGLSGNNFFQNTVNRVSIIAVEHEKECRVREENPAVKAAYEKYLTLLRMTRSYYD